MNFFQERKVENLFNELSQRYDLLNDLLSFGLHRVWKKKLLSFVRPIPGERWIDLCCGTGDLTLGLARLVKPDGEVFGVDYAKKTLLIARERALKEPWLSINWMENDIAQLDLGSECFDGAVMSYGLRNLDDPFIGLQVIYDLLKPNARAGILDFRVHKKKTFSSWFQKNYLRKIVIPIASKFSLSKHYEYLEESLKSFPDGPTQKELAKKVGFNQASYYLLAGGQMGILLLER